MLRGVAVMAAVVVAQASSLSLSADELDRAEQLAWSKKFAEAEAVYRTLPPSRRAQLGLARVVMWSGRYPEAIARFNELLRANANDADALEGRGTAEYWSGDFRGAARDFKRVLQLDAKREFARTSLSAINATTRPSQRIGVFGVRDDQPLDVDCGEVSVTFFSDPLSRWTATLGAMHFDAGDRGARTADYVRLDNETRWRGFTFGAAAGSFDESFIGNLSARWKQVTARIERAPEVASATSLRTKTFSTTTTLRWERNVEQTLLSAQTGVSALLAVAEASHRTYSDDNRGYALVAYAVAPVVKRGAWTVWAGGSGAMRDTEESRFRPTAVSATREGNVFHYRYRSEYDPYWTPDDLREARAVFAIERTIPRGRVKLHADAGIAHDRGRAFGPDRGSTPFPQELLSFPFDRSYNPYRFGLAADYAIAGAYRIEAGAERSVTVDYRSTSFHAALVRRR